MLELQRLGFALRNAIAGGTALLIMQELALIAGLPIAVVPFSCSIIVLLSVPESDGAQPRNVIGGHVICALSGCGSALLLGPNWLSVSIGIAVAMMVMDLSRTVHPPAGLTVLIATLHAKSWDFVLMPVLSGAAILVGLCFIYYRAIGTTAWPRHWF